MVDNERRRGRIAGIVGLLAIVLFVVIGASGLASDFNQADGFAEQLQLFGTDSGEVQAYLILQALTIALFGAPLVSLFISARDRTERVRPALIGLTVAGPLFFAASLIATYFALDAASAAFLDPAADIDINSNDAADDVVAAQSATDVATGLRFAGVIGLVVSIVYTSLWAMRSGLLSRFWGTLGMALGVGTLFIGLPAMLAYFLAMSLMVAGFWPGGRPPAWEAGEAIPWPKPGEEPPEPSAPEEPASPGDFEGSATETTEGTETEDLARPGRRDNKRKRKRKQR